MEDAAIIEQLTNGEIRCLAITSSALRRGDLIVLENDEDPLTEGHAYSALDLKEADRLDLFLSQNAYMDTLVSLQRFGFVRLLPGWDAGAWRPTPRLKRFIDRLDLDGVVL